MRSLTHFCLTKLPQDEMLDCFRPPDQGCEVSFVSEVSTGLREISQWLEKAPPRDTKIITNRQKGLFFNSC